MWVDAVGTGDSRKCLTLTRTYHRLLKITLAAVQCLNSPRKHGHRRASRPIMMKT